VIGPSSFRLGHLTPYTEAFRSWLGTETHVIDTTERTPAQAASEIAEAVITASAPADTNSLLDRVPAVGFTGNAPVTICPAPSSPSGPSIRIHARLWWAIVAATLALAIVLVVGIVRLTVRPDGSPEAAPSPGAETATPVPATDAAGAPPDGSFFPGGFYHESGNPAATAAAVLLAAGDIDSAALLGQIADQPTAIWLGEWYSDALLTSVIQRHVAAAKAQGTTLVFVTYAIPNRDCGGYSKGGHTYANYLAWNKTIVSALAGTTAVVLVEPDSLSMLADPKCASEAEKRLPLIRGAVDILHAAGIRTYLDGGNSNWLTPTQQAEWLTQGGIEHADGFFTNVSNFYPAQAEQDYAGKVSARVGWKHFVIDVSRNGQGWKGTWCNPDGAGLGQSPSLGGGSAKLDALLWVKHPGLSDGTCNGGPPAGQWYESYALDLVRNR